MLKHFMIISGSTRNYGIWILKRIWKSKIHLCEKAEELMLESNVVEAFQSLAGSS